MNEENGKHEFNFFLDKQLQQKLLEANEEILEKEFSLALISSVGSSGVNTSNVSNNKSGAAQQNSKLHKYLNSVHVCGWCPDPNIVYRKSENEGLPRTRGSLAVTRESLYSRDAKSRPQNINNFVFRHYSDPRKYIEQYRREHACYDSTNSSATKSEFLETRRFYAYNQYSPLAVGTNSNSSSLQQTTFVPQPQLDTPIQNNDNNSKHQQTPALHYTNRREQKRNTISASLNTKNQHQFKLSKTPPHKPEVNDYTEEYIESLEVNNNNKQRRSGSAKERSSPSVNGLSIQKSAATKINVPSANFGGKTLRTANTGHSSDSNALPSHLPKDKVGPVTSSRMLDTLACVAGNGTGSDKQPQLPALPVQNTASAKSRNSLSTPSKQKRSTTTATSATIPATTPVASTMSATETNTNTTTCTTPVPAFNSANTSKNNRAKENNQKDNISNKFNNGAYNKTADKNLDGDSSSTDSDVSIGQLSTTCLGADVNIKSRPKLEASSTYHVFPNEFSNAGNPPPPPPGQVLSVWNPGKSAVDEKRPRPNLTNTLLAVELGINGPFRNSPRRPATEETGYRAVEFITKEFVQDTRPLNLRTTDVFRDVARMSVSPGLKTNTIKPDLPPSFSVQGISKRPHFETLKKKKRASKTAVVRRKKEQLSNEDAGRKSWSASTDASNHSASGGNNLRLKPVDTGSSGVSSGASNSTMPMPYFKFWNSSLPPRSRENRRRVTDKMSDINMQQLAEMVLADERGKNDDELAQAAKKVLEHKIKSENEQGIATGTSGVTPTVDRTSKEKLLETLRLVNQRPPKPSPRTLNLTFIQEEKATSNSRDKTHENLPKQQRQQREPTNGGNDLPCHFGNVFGDRNNHCNNATQNFNDNDQIVTESSSCDFNLVTNVPTSHMSNPKKEVISMSEEEEMALMPSLIDAHAQSVFSSTISEWRRIRNDYDEVSSFIRDADSIDHKAKKLVDTSSLSHRRRIKHLIEQSRLKGRVGKMWSHSDVCPDGGVVHKYIDIKSGYGDLNNSVMDSGKKTKKSKMPRFRSVDDITEKFKTSSFISQSPYIDVDLYRNIDDYSFRHSGVCDEKLGSESIVNNEPYNNNKDKSVTSKNSFAFQDDSSAMYTKSAVIESENHGSSDKGQGLESTFLSSSEQKDENNENVRKSKSKRKAEKQKRHSSDKETETQITRQSQNPQQNQKLNCSSSVRDGHSIKSAEHDHSHQPDIPLLYGTAVGLELSGKSRSKRRSINVSPKTNSKLSPLSDSTLKNMAEKMSVKVNVSRLKYTKAVNVERAHSMHL